MALQLKIFSYFKLRIVSQFKLAQTIDHYQLGSVSLWRNTSGWRWRIHGRSSHSPTINTRSQNFRFSFFVPQTLDLPIETSESRSNSEGTGSNRKLHSPETCVRNVLTKFPLAQAESVEKQPSSLQQPSKKLNIQYISCELASNNSNNTDSNSQHQLAPVTQPSIIPADNYSYVQLTAVHDYNYPLAEDPITSVLRRDSTCSLKKRTALDVPESIIKENAMIRARLRCRWVSLQQTLYRNETKLWWSFQILSGILSRRMEPQRILCIRTRLRKTRHRHDFRDDVRSLHVVSLHERLRRRSH